MRKEAAALAFMPIMLSQFTRHRIARKEPIVRVERLPMGMFALSEAVAQRNHGQSLEQLRARGGLDPLEAVAILSAIHYTDIGRLSEETCLHILVAMEDLWSRGQTLGQENMARLKQAAE